MLRLLAANLPILDLDRLFVHNDLICVLKGSVVGKTEITKQSEMNVEIEQHQDEVITN